MDKEIKYMKEALKEANKAELLDEVPIGCVIVKDDKIIARGHNQRETKQSPIGHAEIVAITKASKKLNSWRLEDCTLYVTLEPCLMCKAAIELSRIKNIYYLTSSDKEIQIKNSKYKEQKTGSKEALNMLQSFFKKRR